MLRKLNHKERLIALGVGLALILVLGYQLSIRKTIDLYAENAKLMSLNDKSEVEILNEISFRTAEKSRIDSLKKYVQKGGENAKMIMSLFNEAANQGVSVQEMEEISISGRNLEEAHKLKVQGVFVNFVKFLRGIETGLIGVRIESVKVYTEEDRRSREETLYMDLILTNMAYGS